MPTAEAASTVVSSGSQRRLVALILAPIFVLLNRFLASKGIAEVPLELQEMIVALAGVYILGGNAKEAVIRKAEIAAQTVREGVVTGAPETADKFDALIATDKKLDAEVKP